MAEHTFGFRTRKCSPRMTKNTRRYEAKGRGGNP